MEQSISKTHSMILCGMFAALVAVGAFIQIPVPFMDYFTLQFLFVLLAGIILGPIRGATSVGVYVLIGLCGVPVFAAGGGLAYIIRPSFGYLLGFIVASYVVGMITKKRENLSFRKMLIACLIAMGVVYFIGIIYKYCILNFYVGTSTGIWSLLLAALPLDIPGDILLCFVAAYIGKKIRTRVRV
ncbi:MAG: biotin transporter BioY [Clostridium sp.]|uniref:biotin transporter BioY n=1 Tax=Clostridium sp. TaxID=1506 RepID=UPI003050418A